MAALPLSYYIAMRESYLYEKGLIRPVRERKPELPYEVEGDLEQ